MTESVEIQRLRQMLKAARSLLRELAIACARVEEELERAHHAQPKEAQHGQTETAADDIERYCAVA